MAQGCNSQIFYIKYHLQECNLYYTSFCVKYTTTWDHENKVFVCHNHNNRKLPCKQTTLYNDAFRNVTSCICLCSMNFFYEIFLKGNTCRQHMNIICQMKEKKSFILFWGFVCRYVRHFTGRCSFRLRSNRLTIWRGYKMHRISQTTKPLSCFCSTMMPTLENGEKIKITHGTPYAWILHIALHCWNGDPRFPDASRGISGRGICWFMESSLPPPPLHQKLNNFNF